MKKYTKILLSILCVIFLGVFVFSGYKLYSIIHEYRADQKLYSGLSGEFVTQNSGDQAPSQSNSPDSQEPREVSPISVDFDALMSQSQYVVGWLYCADTVINYPVAQAEDNFYFLERYIDGRYNGCGSLFIDCTCYGDFSGRNTVIYGHHMNDGSMFASICKYGKQEYYDAHPVMYLNTPTQNYRVDIFTGFITSADSSVYTFEFSGDDEYGAFLEKMKGFSDFDCDVEVGVEDRIITLSTCTYEYDNARYVVMGKLVPID
ncbi:MAG: class B sortase [Candidatus Limivicinus sp.]